MKLWRLNYLILINGKVCTGDTNVPTPLDGKYLKAPTYDQVFDVTSDWLNKSSVGTFYKYAVLTPKAGSQIAKTILSPLTHTLETY